MLDMKWLSVVFFCTFFTWIQFTVSFAGISGKSIGYDSNCISNSKTIDYSDITAWYYSKVSPIADRFDLTLYLVNKNEVDSLKRSYNSIYPEANPDENIILTALQAKQCIQTNLGIHADENSMVEKFQEVGCSDVSEVDAHAFIELTTLFEMDKVKEYIGKIRKEMENNVKKSMNSIKYWQPKDLVIDDLESICLVKHKDSTNCQIDIKRFNEQLKYYKIVKFIPLDTARRMILRNILADDFIYHDASNRGLLDNDSVVRLQSRWLENAAKRYKFTNTPLMDCTEDELSKTYGKYYDLMFSSGRTYYYSVIGSNSKKMIDSLFGLLSTATNSEFNWSVATSDELPDGLAHFADTLVIGEITGPIETAYGYFIIRLDSLIKKPQITYEEARETVALIVAKKKWRNLDSIIWKKAEVAFNSDRYIKNIYDTIKLEYVLMPGTSIADTKTEKSILYGQKESFDGMASALVSYDLPEIIRTGISELYKHSNDSPTKIHGPYNTVLGVYFFRKLEHRNNDIKLSFEEVRKSLVDSVLISEIDQSDNNYFENPDSLTKKIALTRVCTGIILNMAMSGKRENQMDYNVSPISVQDDIDSWINNMRYLSY